MVYGINYLNFLIETQVDKNQKKEIYVTNPKISGYLTQAFFF